MQKDNQDFESVWKEWATEFTYEYDLFQKSVALHFFNAGVASTKRKPEQIPALFKPKESNGK